VYDIRTLFEMFIKHGRLIYACVVADVKCISALTRNSPARDAGCRSFSLFCFPVSFSFCFCFSALVMQLSACGERVVGAGGQTFKSDLDHAWTSDLYWERKLRVINQCDTEDLHFNFRDNLIMVCKSLSLLVRSD
jgi:hypothetical protein